VTRAPELVVALEQGAKIALVSDAGCRSCPTRPPSRHALPAASRSRRSHSRPSALLASLSASAYLTKNFSSSAFCPRGAVNGAAPRTPAHRDRTIILYEAPHRVSDCVADAREVLGNRSACIAREVTKLHEEFRRGKLSELSTSLEQRPHAAKSRSVGPAPAGAHARSAQFLAQPRRASKLLGA